MQGWGLFCDHGHGCACAVDLKDLLLLGAHWDPICTDLAIAHKLNCS